MSRPATRGPTVTPHAIKRNADLALRLIALNPRTSPGAGVQTVRAHVRGNLVIIHPERSDFPGFDLPNNTRAKGFSPGFFSHDYLVVNLAPAALVGSAGLALVGDALALDPTPGKDGPPTATGTRNNVGGLVWFDGDTNFVRTYTIPSSDLKRSRTIVNYTIQGEHTMSEGFVLRFGRLRKDNRIELVTYGEGNAIKQSFLTSPIWRREVSRVWTVNAEAVFAAAAAGRHR